MSSSTPPGSGPLTVPELCAAVEQIEAGAALIAGALVDREQLDLGSVPTDVVADLTVRLLKAADRITAAGTVTSTRSPATRPAR